MPNRITEVTKRDIRELLSALNIYGRLDEVEFLERLYDLDALPSLDSRYSTARQDIIQHRYANDDWENDWLFEDSRFGLRDGSDSDYMRFLAELLHPVVRSDQNEIDNLLNELNGLLAPDGYRLIPTGQISGRDVFGWEEISPIAVGPRSTEQHFTDDIRPLVATLVRLAELDGSELEQAVLQSADPRLEEPEYDNWDGGTYYYTLTLVTPVEVFARLGDQVQPIEEKISNRISQVLRAPDFRHISAVVIQPSVLNPETSGLASVVAGRSERPDPQFWAPDQFRLFISHVSSFKQRATALRQELSRFHMSGFVAHETIDPGELWQKEIESALNSMHALVALLTPDYSGSAWTDQEVGWALGSGVYVLPVRRGADPYGFIGEVQGIQGVGQTVPGVADEIFKTLLRKEQTRAALQEAIVAGFENSASFKRARENITLLERAERFPSSMLSRIEVAARSNGQIQGSFGVDERVGRLLARH